MRRDVGATLRGAHSDQHGAAATSSMPPERDGSSIQGHLPLTGWDVEVGGPRLGLKLDTVKIARSNTE